MPFDANESTHPAWEEGRRAFRAKLRLDDCPHAFLTDAYDAWRQGWQEAMADENRMTPKFDGRRRR